MATYKTPEELRAWSRSFYFNKSKIIKRGFYNYIDPKEKKIEAKAEDETASAVDETEKQIGGESEIDAAAMASSIIAGGNASSADINALLALDSSTIDEMNKQFPSTEEQISNTKKESSVLKK